MTDCFKPEERSRIMARIRSNGNQTTELRFVRILRDHRISGWRRGIKLPGRPDFVFAKHKVVVFIDGDFWHGNPRGFRLPKSNCKYWEAKIKGNKNRDRRINKELKKMGWRVVRFWESSLKNEQAIITKLKCSLCLPHRS
jgi:DNA mismatch endonuclease (patch repair protein)